MSKRFKGLLCAYCSQRPAVTGDHLFAREFFLKTQRANLPQVPTCDRCNGEKSKLEHYLTAVLPFGGRHPDALTNLSQMVEPRLAKNKNCTDTSRGIQLGSGREPNPGCMPLYCVAFRT
jgi:hypothetical protein